MSRLEKEKERQKLLKKYERKKEELSTYVNVTAKKRKIDVPGGNSVRCAPVFSLPQQVVPPIVASSFPKYRKKTSEVQKRGKENQILLK